MRFAVISDLHFPSRRTRAAAFVAAVVASATVDFVITPGDLTDSEDASPLAGATCWCIGSAAEKQLQEYVKLFDAPLHRAGKPVYAVPGNHDARRWGSSVVDFVRSRHGSTRYIVLRDGVALVFFGVYPDSAGLAWFASELLADPALRTTPIAFFFHYNLEGIMSDWWTKAEKDAFREAITGLNVLGIFVGHNHVTYSHTWNDHPVHCTGGDDFWVLVDAVDAALKITFVAL